MSTRKGRVQIGSTVKPPAADDVMSELLGAAPGTEPTPTAQPNPAESKNQESTRPRMTVYISRDTQTALRAAVYWTRNQPNGYENLSDLLEDAAQEKIKALQELYNNGEPFPDLPQGKQLRRGRPIGR